MPNNAALARALQGKPLSPAGEQEFQRDLQFAPGWRDWRRDFIETVGTPPNTDPGGDYNYRLAWASGTTPEMDPVSNTYHGLSEAVVPPYNPIPLKAEDHPTRWKAEFMQKFGQNPDLPSGDWTPEMSQFVSDQMRRDMIANLLKQK